MKCILQGQKPLDMVSNPNLLDNAYFIGGGSQQGGGNLPINQRGKLSYTGGPEYYNSIYGLDRWLSSGTVTIDNDGVTCTAANYVPQFLQYIESTRVRSGLVYTASALVNGRLVTGTGVIDVTLPTYSNMFEGTNSELTIEVSKATGDMIAVSIKSSNGTIPKIMALKLEEGSTQTLAHQDAFGNWVLNDPAPNYALELLKCQRYQYVPTCNAVSAWSVIGFGSVIDSGFQLTIFPPTPLRIVPSVIISGNWDIRGTGDWIAFNPNSDGITVYCMHKTESSISVEFAGLQGIKHGNVYQFTVHNDQNAQLILDANL